LRRDYEAYQKLTIDTMFLDEAQFIKNPLSQSAKSVKKIQAAHRFALTGTPIENSLSELWSIFDYIMPGYLLGYQKFTERYERPIVREENKEVRNSLVSRIQPFILRRLKKDVLTELPDKIETKLVTEMTEEQRLLYLSYLNHVREELDEKNQIEILSALTRLRQICCHPSTFVENYTGESGKLELLLEQLPDILEGGHRVLIFSQFTTMLSIIGEALTNIGISYFYLDGATKSEERIDFVKRFNKGEKEVFLISLKAGGTGINLTGADTVIHYDPWWNPAVEEQATDRVYRIGQTNRVQVIKLITKDSIEEKIYKLQEKKKALSESIIEAKEVFINKLTREELTELFS
jgi:SNF2 family DNA or RNA helicase